MAKFDFKQYVEDNMEFQRSGETFHINCVDPECDDNWKLGHHLYVYPDGRRPHCYKCGKNFSPVEFIMHAEECSLTTAMRRVLEATPRVKRPEFPLDKIMKDYFDGDHGPGAEEDRVELPFSVPIEEGSDSWEYLKGRRFGREIHDHFGLSFCPYHRRFEDVLITPAA
jgi:hypothetical protein